jgi:hypothetical protein
MIKIEIEWQSLSPLLQTGSGFVYVDYVPTPGNQQLLDKFEVSFEPGSIGYKSIGDKKGISSVILNSIEHELNLAVRAFRDGVVLSNRIFLWTNDNTAKKIEQKFIKPSLRTEKKKRKIKKKIKNAGVAERSKAADL